MYPIDFVCYYTFNNRDFELDNNVLDFSLDYSQILDINLIEINDIELPHNFAF